MFLALVRLAFTVWFECTFFYVVLRVRYLSLIQRTKKSGKKTGNFVLKFQKSFLETGFTFRYFLTKWKINLDINLSSLIGKSKYSKYDNNSNIISCLCMYVFISPS